MAAARKPRYIDMGSGVLVDDQPSRLVAPASLRVNRLGVAPPVGEPGPYRCPERHVPRPGAGGCLGQGQRQIHDRMPREQAGDEMADIVAGWAGSSAARRSGRGR